jgi:hypothetical protein
MAIGEHQDQFPLCCASSLTQLQVLDSGSVATPTSFPSPSLPSFSRFACPIFISDPHTDAWNNMQLLWVGSVGYSCAITLLKATVLLQYRRVFPLPDFQRRCDIFLAFVFAWAVAGTLGALLICLPIERNWDALAPTNCGTRMYFWEVYAILHVISDVLILILPLPLLKTLPLPRLQKGVLMAVFCLGFL